ncbi:fatty-acid amide hydrolase 2-A-like [Parasteatoda tepidariorum]|uniref:fatty-acid amide hydrolase 2-A-like n=1 Tax=Parasteatoda tepidariorum TaxID=114398 RepID=UPI0039BD5F23
MYLIHRIIAGRKRALPPTDDGKILFMSATELAEKIRNRELRCEDVIRSYYKRAQEVQPIINAITDARYESALKEAKQIDTFLEKDSKSPEEIKKRAPLLGVPFTCKEVLGIEGLHQTSGIYAKKNNIAHRDGDAPALYRAAGAIPVTVTNVPELCCTWITSNTIYGETKNPYDTTRISGGSSGGEAALIASCGAVIGIGTDLGGSIRIPSSLCGIYGHKPSSGVVSNRGYYPYIEIEEMPFDYMNCTGPMCRYVEDLLLLMKILCKNDPRLDLDRKVDFRRVKIYYMEETPNNPVSPVIKQAIRKVSLHHTNIILAATHFEERYGVKAIPLQLPEFEYCVDIFRNKILEFECSFKIFLQDENGKVRLWLEVLKYVLGISKHTAAFLSASIMEKTEKDQYYYEILERCDSLKRKLQKLLQEDAIFLLPSVTDIATFCNMSLTKIMNYIYTTVINSLYLPATSVPAGLHNGLPIAFQVISGQFNDRLTIAAAVELNTVFGGWKNPCSTTARKVWGE